MSGSWNVSERAVPLCLYPCNPVTLFLKAIPSPVMIFFGACAKKIAARTVFVGPRRVQWPLPHQRVAASRSEMPRSPHYKVSEKN